MSLRLRTATMNFASVMLMLWGATSQARILQPNERLTAGESVHSVDSRYVAHMQGDGNLVVYRNDGSRHAVWSTGTHGAGVSAIMQGDGNFVIYDGGGRALWWTATNGRDRTFTVSEHGQAMVIAPGKVGRRAPAPGSEMWKRLRVKPVWVSPGHDAGGGRPNGPHCVGDPRACVPHGVNRKIGF